MGDGTVWTKALRWPRSGPVRWLTLYCLAVVFAGFAFWLSLGFVRPTAPDAAAGYTYQVPGSRRSPDVFVTRGEAYVLRFAAAHLVVCLVVAGGVGLWNAGARTPPRRG